MLIQIDKERSLLYVRYRQNKFLPMHEYRLEDGELCMRIGEESFVKIKKEDLKFAPPPVQDMFKIFYEGEKEEKEENRPRILKLIGGILFFAILFAVAFTISTSTYCTIKIMLRLPTNYCTKGE